MANRRRTVKTPRMVEAVDAPSPRAVSAGGRLRGARPKRTPLGRAVAWLLTLGVVGSIVGVGVVAGIFLYYGSDPAMPRIDHVGDYHPKVVTRVLDRSGELIGEIYDERRTLVPRDKIPPVMVHAIVDAEDAQFFEHKGLNYWGMLRAVIYNLRPGAHLQGASTITQQLVKTYLLKTNERTIKRKVQEAILARRLESALSKDEILYLYLNQIYFGHRRYGVEEAARFFFGKSVSDVNAGEAALLASLPKGPEEISPLRHPERAKDRQRYVLSQMLRYNHISKADAEKFASAPITVVKNEAAQAVAPEFVDEARRQLIAKHGEDKLPYLGLEVQTTCDARVQKLAREALHKQLENLDERQGYRKPLGHVKTLTPQAIASVLDERAVRRLHQLLGDSPSRKQRDKWLEDRAKALEAGKVTEAVVVEVRTDPADYGLVVDTGGPRGFLRAPKPGSGTHDRYNPKELPLEKRFSVGDVITVRAEPSLGRHPAPGDAPAKKESAKEPARPAPKDGNAANTANTAKGKPTAPEDDDADADPEDKSGWPLVVPEFGPQGAVVVIDPVTRDVRAMVGGYGFHAGGFNRATQARRQPGSAFKPFLYAAALDGGKYTLASVLNDSPQIYEQDGLKAWKPKNAESHEFMGPVRLRVALARSLNTVASQLIFDLTPPKVVQMARAAGITSPLEETLALGLGASGVTLTELTNAYATFAGQGRRADPRQVSRLGTDEVPPPRFEQTIPEELAYLVTSLMESVINEGTAASAKAKLRRPAAGKTGTTSSQRDAWFVGFTPDVVAGVWVGFDDMRDLGRGEQGARSALPVWVDVVTGALKGVPPSPFSQPAAIQVVKIDPATGLLAPPGAANALDEVFLAGTAPAEVAPAAGEQNPDTFLIDGEANEPPAPTGGDPTLAPPQ